MYERRKDEIRRIPSSEKMSVRRAAFKGNSGMTWLVTFVCRSCFQLGGKIGRISDVIIKAKQLYQQQKTTPLPSPPSPLPSFFVLWYRNGGRVVPGQCCGRGCRCTQQVYAVQKHSAWSEGVRGGEEREWGERWCWGREGWEEVVCVAAEGWGGHAWFAETSWRRAPANQSIKQLK